MPTSEVTLLLLCKKKFFKVSLVGATRDVQTPCSKVFNREVAYVIGSVILTDMSAKYLSTTHK